MDPWVPSGLAAAASSILMAMALREGDWFHATLIAVSVALCIFSAIRLYRQRSHGASSEQADSDGPS